VTMSSIEADLRRRIEQFDQEIKALAAQRYRHQAALEALHGSKKGKPRRDASASRRSARRAPRGRRRQQVVDHLSQHPGARPSEIASAIKASPNQVSALIRRLRDDKQVVKSGKGYKLSKAAADS
jgi:hypothetical protein